MPGIPRQRKGGQTGGRYGQNANARASRARGGSPGASKKSCALFLFGLIVIPAVAVMGIASLLA